MLSADDYDRLAPMSLPGYEALHEIAACSLAVHLDPHLTKDILLVGVGTGQELKHVLPLSEHWRFTVIDPNREHLDAARVRAEELGGARRITFVESTLEEASLPQRYDAAFALLVSSFLPTLEKKFVFFQALRDAVRPGAAVAVADYVGDRGSHEFAQIHEVWRTRWALAGHYSPEQIAATETSLLGGGTAGSSPLLHPVTNSEYQELLLGASLLRSTELFRSLLVSLLLSEAAGPPRGMDHRMIEKASSSSQES